MGNIMVFMPGLSKRAEYIFSLILEDLIGLDVILTDSRNEFLAFSGPCIEYAAEPSGKGIFIHAHSLLIETSVKPQSIQFFNFHKYPAFFHINDDRSAFPFDLFAASFFLITRYEEYLNYKPDRFDRFRATDSINFKGNFINLPIVNLWSGFLKDHLRMIYPSITFREKKFRFIPTIDIDHAFAYRQRSFLRTVGGYSRSLMKGKLRNIVDRSNVLLGIEKDPYDQYDYIHAIHENYGLRPLYFILFADYGKDDNNVTLSGPVFQNLLHNLDKTGLLGIHPSLTSGKYPRIFEREIKGLSMSIGHKITISRQHFLKSSFPRTFTQLIKYKIANDYSLGYATNYGFRAGIADPFPFFNLLDDKVESLILHPVSLMDVTLKDYLKKSPEEAIQAGRSVIDAIKAVNGEFVSVWHNESFDESGRWKGWRKVYADLVSYASGI